MLLDHLTDAAHYTTMASNSFFQSPTVVLPPSGEHYFASSHYIEQNTCAPAINGISPNGLSNSNPFTANASTSNTILPIGLSDTNTDVSISNTGMDTSGSSLAGRKRSRTDIYSEDEEEDASVATPPSGGVKKPRGQPIYGPGMSLIYPEDPSYEMAVESQSGTWVEERAERKQFTMTPTKRPSMNGRKSARIDSSASAPDDLAQLVLPPQMREVTTELLIDEATRTLGISWTRMDSTEALQINQKAYAKWIQNHYVSLKDVAIWFENSAIPGYLVAANNAYNGQREYYIFSDDLTEARLVTNEPSQLMPRLKMLPALHLAAPGGHIRAEADALMPAQNELGEVQGVVSQNNSRLDGTCAAHAMELD